MKIGFRLAFAWVFPVTLLHLGAARAQSPTTERVSVSTGGAQLNLDGYDWTSISADGRCVVFVTLATNLVAGDTNGFWDVFVRDRLAGTTERVSVATGGTQGNADSHSWTSISADGRFVAFGSDATNLVALDTNGFQDVFVRDRTNGTTERVSLASSGSQGSAGSSFPSISADGRYVTFMSDAPDLVALDTNGGSDIFLRDRTNGTTELVSVATGGGQSVGASTYSSISADGRYVAFRSSADLVVGDTNGLADIFVRDRLTGTTERVSVSTAGVQTTGLSHFPSISADGSCVAWHSSATELVLGDTNGFTDVFVRDRLAGTTERVSVATGGAQANSDSFYATLSADGRYVTFHSPASNLVAGDTNAYADVFVRDRLAGTTERASVAAGGAQANHLSGNPSISADGRFIAFWSYASNLVAGDTNWLRDYFVRDRGPQPPSAYCTAGVTTNGCSASITASANPSLSLASACNITVTSVEGQKSGLCFYGIDNSAFAPAPWGAGTSWLCVKAPTQRTPIQNSGGTVGACDGTFALDWNAYQSTHPLALGNPWSAGDKVYVQAWFRDPLAVKSTNLSDALEMTYLP